LADELARQPERNNLISVLPVNAEKSIAEAVKTALLIKERSEEAVTFQVIDQISS